jgi:hypothetical protein
VGATTYQQSQLQALWIQAGGNPAAAPMASAIALAESGGDPGTGPNATNDWGLWQIHNGGPAMLNPLANAQRAVSMSNNGANWRPWCTAYADAACGTKGGAFLGAGSPFLRYMKGVNGTTPAAVGTGSGTPAAVANAPADTGTLFRIPIPIPGVPDITITRSNGRALAGGLALVGGGLVLMVGLVVLATGTTEGIAARMIGKAITPGTVAPVKQEPLTPEEAEQKKMYDDELAERRRSKVANREGLAKPA